jgi:hypothetical protein
MTSRLTFLYVVDGPRLQAQGLLLAASLRRTHPKAEQIAYLPAAGAADVPVAVRAGLTALGADCRVLPVQQVWKRPYSHGNKILALAQARESDWSVFLDTDMISAQPLAVNDLPGPMQVSVVPEGILGWGKEFSRWEVAYSHFGLAVPEERVRMLRGARRLSPPYFNAGFVAIREGDRVEGKGFGELWLETAREFDWKVPVGGKRPWLDQASLPIAMARHGFAHKIVDERNNTSISNGRPLEGLDPAIIHYHRSSFLRRWPGAEEMIDQAVQDMPPGHRDAIASLLAEGGFLGGIPVETDEPPGKEQKW